MGIGNTATGWRWPARLLHSGMAGLILFQLSLGFRMVRLVDDIYVKFGLYQTHKSWGFVIFALAILRLAWRASQPTPQLSAGMRRFDVAAARGAHLALYRLMIVLLVSGWLMASASPLEDEYGMRTMVFAWFALPDPYQPGSKALEAVFRSVHAWAAFAMAVLLVGHAAAALRHHFACRDAVLQRMVLGR